MTNPGGDASSRFFVWPLARAIRMIITVPTTTEPPSIVTDRSTERDSVAWPARSATALANAETQMNDQVYSPATKINTLSMYHHQVGLSGFWASAAGCPACKMVGAATGTPNAAIRYNEQSSADSWVRGWTPSMGPIYDLDLSSGRSITDSDMNAGANVVVIGHDIQENLMAGVDPLGKEIRVDGHLYQVIGVAAPKGKTLGLSQDNWVLMPITTWFKQYGSRRRSRECHAQGIPAFCAIAPVKSCAVALFAWTIFGATSRTIRRSWLAPTTHESA